MSIEIAEVAYVRQMPDSARYKGCLIAFFKDYAGDIDLDNPPHELASLEVQSFSGFSGPGEKCFRGPLGCMMVFDFHRDYPLVSNHACDPESTTGPAE